MAYRKLRQIPARLVIDILKGKVETEEGGIFTSSEEKKAPGRAGRKGETIDEYFYHINGRQLTVSNDGFKALAAGVTYRVYYLPWAKHVLSIEPIVVHAGAATATAPASTTG